MYQPKEIIAIILYKIGFKPRATIFIDKETIMWGYGKLYGSIGVWEYNIPTNYWKNKTNQR